MFSLSLWRQGPWGWEWGTDGGGEDGGDGGGGGGWCAVVGDGWGCWWGDSGRSFGGVGLGYVGGGGRLEGWVMQVVVVVGIEYYCWG